MSEDLKDTTKRIGKIYKIVTKTIKKTKKRGSDSEVLETLNKTQSDLLELLNYLKNKIENN